MGQLIRMSITRQGNTYSRTYRQRPPRMQSFSVPLRELIYMGSLIRRGFKLQFVQFRVVTYRSSHTLSSVVNSANKEVNPWVKRSLSRGQTQRKILKPSSKKVIALAYKRWGFMRASHPNELTEKFLAFWEMVASKSWLHMKVGLYLDTFVRGDKTVLAATLIYLACERQTFLLAHRR